MRVTFIKNQTFENEIVKIMTIRRIPLIRLIITFVMIFDDYAFFIFLLLFPTHTSPFPRYLLSFSSSLFIFLSSYFCLYSLSLPLPFYLFLSLPLPTLIFIHPSLIIVVTISCISFFFHIVSLCMKTILKIIIYLQKKKKNITITAALCLSYEYAN